MHDEFYTEYADIEREVNAYPNVFRDKNVLVMSNDDPQTSNFAKFFKQNFEQFGISELVCLELYCVSGRRKLCRIYKTKKSFKERWWYYIQEEKKNLIKKADIIIANPIFTETKDLILSVLDKQFLIVGSINTLAIKEIFPLFAEGKIRLGAFNNNAISRSNFGKTQRTCWITNMQHGKKNPSIQLMTMADNLQCNKRLIKTLPYGKYQKYDNYNAIEIPFVKAIPSDYDGIMGVPITYLEKHNPEQFALIGILHPKIKGKNLYTRVLIMKHKHEGVMVLCKHPKHGYCWMNRRTTEIPDEEGIRQVIPYIVIKDGFDRIALFKRLIGDNRLIGLHTIGAGGHVEAQDLRDSIHETIKAAALREIKEELNISPSEIVIDFNREIKLDDTEVNRAHLGIPCFCYDCCAYKYPNTEIKFVGWYEKDKITENLEPWSKHLLEML